MKLKDEFALKNILDTDVLLDTSGKFDGIIKLNKTMSVICQGLKDGLDANGIAKAVCEKFDVSFDKALEDVKTAILELKKQGLIDD